MLELQSVNGHLLVRHVHACGRIDQWSVVSMPDTAFGVFGVFFGDAHLHPPGRTLDDLLASSGVLSLTMGSGLVLEVDGLPLVAGVSG